MQSRFLITRVCWLFCLLFGTGAAGSSQASFFSIVHDFSAGATNGGGLYELNSVIEGSDRRLYGTTAAGGPYSGGRVFRMERDGSGYQVLHSFAATPTDGNEPRAGVIEGSDGRLYGTTYGGGNFGIGTIYGLERDGTGYGVVHHFSTNLWDGFAPRAGLLEGSDGRLYGTSRYGGTNGQGTVFALNKDGSNFAVIRSMIASATGAGYPEAALMEGSDGALYGTAWNGVALSAGAFFRLQKDGSFTLLGLFANGVPGGGSAGAALLEGSDGNLYGTTVDGGTNGFGAIIRMATDGSDFITLHHFAGFTADGGGQKGPLVEGRDGFIYGSTSSGGTNGEGTVYRVGKDGSQYQLLHHFSNGTEGYRPRDGLIAARDGAFYGVAPKHGSGGVKEEFGVVFRLGHRLGFSRTGNQAHLVADGIPGFTYAIERSVNLSTWLRLNTFGMPNGGQVSQDYTLQGNVGFFRLVVP